MKLLYLTSSLVKKNGNVRAQQKGPSINNSKSSCDWLEDAKYYYDKYNCRYFAPFLLLFFYSLLGAWIFYLVENSNEKEMKL
ncbi:hypothetical protein ANCDUO_25655 [Ancylostoma duodenale]|uniref:Uncharacterized protein n=1 Tax=Ancylostoma duodenale TaxID=51022 RepID=A0A0C2F730_9BILA|nr:hypothetical protein ANCDUO_25655 [Ancylostoma duodenale]